jgi:CheY-like chemotaxis protein
MMLRIDSSMDDARVRAAFSVAQTVGQGREIPYSCRKPSCKDYADVIVALVCLAVMLGTVYFAEIDSNYSTVMRMTSAIHRMLGIRDGAGSMVDTRHTILVVENDENQRLIATTTLERYGYNVVLADNGVQAMNILRRAAGRVALVLLNTRSSSVQAMQQIKGLRPRVPILVSAKADEKLLPAAAGRIDYPFTAVPLAETVQKALRAGTL